MGMPKTPLEDLNDLPPRWLIALGSAVHGLIQRFDAMPRFREMVKGWVAQHEEEEKTLADWQERRRRHFMHAVIRSPRLRNRAKGPPEPDWVFETYSVPNLRATEPDGSTRPVHINGWVSPDLCYRSEPPVTPLLPLKADRALSLVEKYTLLAAIHDYACAGEEKIDPWHNEWPSAISKTQSLRWCLSLHFYQRGSRKLLPAVAAKQEPVLSDFLADVEKDLVVAAEMALAKQSGSGGAGAGTALASIWQDVQRRLLELVEKGERFTSYSELGVSLKCSKNTVRKALGKSQKLRAWKNAEAKKSPRAQSLNAVVMDKTRSNEPDPADMLPAEDVDRIMARLIEQAKPQERAQLNAMDARKRQEMARLVLEQDRDQHIEEKARRNKILGRKP